MADPNKQRERLRKLRKAIQAGEIERVRKLCSGEKSDISPLVPLGIRSAPATTALHLAVSYNRLGKRATTAVEQCSPHTSSQRYCSTL